MTHGSELMLRLAGPPDSADLLAWRNDPLTRANSRNTGPVAPAEHEAWLVRTLANPNRRLWVAERDGDRLGTVSAARHDSGEVELSVTVAPAMRGQGAGTAMIRAAVATVQAIWPGAAIRAVVRDGNAASRHLFERCGFVLAEEADGFRSYRYHDRP